jgi:DNA (cytosine-5)-methyltransferase 1
MNVLDLFSGIGGFSLGLERAGMRTVAFCEIDPFCRRVLAKHWPGVPCHEDITKLRGADVGPVDVICGGFPCQDISLAGKGAGLEGDRSGLWRDYARLIGELRPRYVIVENVSALLSRGLGDVLGDLAALGYDAEWHCIPASAVGAPHRRDRIWIVAYPSRVGLHGITDGTGLAEASGDDARGEAGGVSFSPAAPDAFGGQFSYSGPIGRMGWGQSFSRHPRWEIASEPFVRRGNHGISHRSYRLRALGNAVVPQIPEIIGRAIMSTKREL